MWELVAAVAVFVAAGVVAIVKDGGVRPASYRRDWSVGAMIDRQQRS
jgi:hypothetical protein